MLRRPDAGTIPVGPGSYQFKDGQGRVLYVGKAANLRSRLSNYFASPDTLLPRTRQMVSVAETVEWIEVSNEVEALFLEYNLIKRHMPRFNIRYKDDKSYPYLAVTLDEEWPRAMVMRGAKRKGVRYFGPYAHAYAIRETLDDLVGVAIEEGQQLLHQRVVRRMVDLADARAGTLLDVEQQARTPEPCVVRVLVLATGADGERAQ